MLIYEMVAGYPPFYQEDRVAMFRAICSTDFKFPSHFSKARTPVHAHMSACTPDCTVHHAVALMP